MSKPGVFYMYFSFDDGTEQLCGFNITPEGVEQLQSIIDDGEFYEEFIDGIESEFGVHDWSSSPNEAVEGIGITSDEIDKNMAAKCMDRWISTIGDFVGDECVSSKWVEIDLDYNDDLDVYNKINEQLI
jgi:hypothetical protein